VLAAAGTALAATGHGRAAGSAPNVVHAGSLAGQALLSAAVLGCYLMIAASGD
jgi:hypothetical protein